MTDDLPRRLEYMPLDDLVARMDPRNVKAHDDAGIASSLVRFGYTTPIEIDERTGKIVAGHGRVDNLTAARVRSDDIPEGIVVRDGVWLAPVVRGWESADDDEAQAYMITTNILGERGGWLPALGDVLLDLQQTDLGLPPGFSTEDLDRLLADLRGPDPDYQPRTPNPPLAERFLVPPFTVLDARTGRWRERKTRWLSLGVRSEIGRGESLTYNGPGAWNSSYYEQKRAAEERLGRALSNEEFERDHMVISGSSSIERTGTSVFDPVLAELALRWYSAPGATVLDPFAGGAIRGVVAAALDRRYVGVELRSEQVDANVAQWETELRDRLPEGVPEPVWLAGDSRDLPAMLDGHRFDLLFSCPPYADLEIYSDDPADLSNMTPRAFDAAYRDIIEKAAALLADDRFAVWVVGEVRDRKTGRYRGLVPLTIDAFERAGLSYQNEAILVTPVGARSVAAGRNFPPNRRLIKTHQTVLTFAKGDPHAAAEAAGDVDLITAAELLADLDLPEP